MKLTLLVLRCTDLAASQAFYEMLGLKFRKERHLAGPEHFSASTLGGTVLELYPYTHDREANLTSFSESSRLGFAVRDLESLAATLRAREGLHSYFPEPPERWVKVWDPDGRVVMLTQDLAHTKRGE